MVPPVCLKDRADPRSTLPGEIQPMRDLSVDPLDFHPSIMSYRKRKVLQQCFFSSSKEFDWQVVWVKTRPPLVMFTPDVDPDLRIFASSQIRTWAC